MYLSTSINSLVATLLVCVTPSESQSALVCVLVQFVWANPDLRDRDTDSGPEISSPPRFAPPKSNSPCEEYACAHN